MGLHDSAADDKAEARPFHVARLVLALDRGELPEQAEQALSAIPWLSSETETATWTPCYGALTLNVSSGGVVQKSNASI